VGIDGVFELCWKRIEREDLPFGERLARGSFGGGFGFLEKSLE
jgi:hypothetical protein